MLLMIIVFLVVVGLCLGSFVNALVWRMREQEELADTHGAVEAGKGKGKESAKSATGATVGRKETGKAYQRRLSILKGRSMCPQCHHALSGRDLVPVVSWVALRGKCRYCQGPISWQYPLVELLTAGLFVWSYLAWPVALSGPAAAAVTGGAAVAVVMFGLWLVLLTGLLALLVYDLRWLLLPNRIMYPLGAVAGMWGVLTVAIADKPAEALLALILAVLVGGGLFYVLFQVSGGKWIGGGDVKLGWLLGLIVATPARSLLVIFIASLLGSLVSLPLLVMKRLRRTSVIPFGPFLIIAAIIVQLYGADILHWYRHLFLAIG